MLIENSKKKQNKQPAIHVHVHIDGKEVKTSTKSESKKNDGKRLLKG